MRARSGLGRGELRRARLVRLGPIVAQLAQAATSFSLLLTFAHLLGPAAFGIFAGYALLYVLLMSAFRAIIGAQLLASRDAGSARTVAHLAEILSVGYLVLGIVAVVLTGHP